METAIAALSAFKQIPTPRSLIGSPAIWYAEMSTVDDIGMAATKSIDSTMDDTPSVHGLYCCGVPSGPRQ